MLPSIFNTCIPRAEIQAGELSVDLFAAKIRPVVEGNAPLVYKDANTFFANTFATDGIQTLIREVFGRLTGATAGSPVIRLETSFGGGKTHDEIAIWHICKQGRRIEGLDRFADLTLIPNDAVQVAAIDGRDLDPENGVYHASTGIATLTLWGEIAYQIGGIAGYQLLRGSDTSGISPGTSVLERLTAGKPTVIILDEIARYLRAAEAKVVGQSTLSKQVVAFLFSLMDLAASVNNLILVYSLASASDTFSEETTELNEVIRASARQERVLSPSTDIEIYNIVKQRLFESVSSESAQEAAQNYLYSYRASRINLPDGSQDAPYANAIESSYPFHPELFSLLTKKIASIPEFQRTRGALRLLAMVVRHLWQNPTEWIPMIHTHHIPVGVEAQVTDELTSRLQRPMMRNPIQADLYNASGREAYAQVQDQQWIVAGKPPFSTWVARTIFLHSLTQGISSGIRRAELNLSLLTPGLEIGFVDPVLDKLTSVTWYLDNDPITSVARFKEEPSINKIITEEKEQVGRTQAKDDLRSRRDSIFASKIFKLVIPDSPADVEDVADPIALCIIDFDEATVSSSQDSAPHLLEQIFDNTGESGKFRILRNRLLFLIANKQELERTIDLAREHKAIKNILASPNRLEDISESQQKQLRQKDGEIDLRLRIALTNTYRHLFYPANDPVKAPKGLMHYTLPAQDASTVKGKNNQQEVILKALRDCGKIRAETEDLAKPFAPAYILQKVWPSGIEHWTSKSLREEFSKNLALNMPIEAEIPKLRTTVRRGLEEGQWDMKVGERLFIKGDDGNFTLPETIEFSDRMVLYRRGILEPPKPKEVELSAQLMPSTEAIKPVRVRWKAKGALTISLYQDDTEISQEFRPSDEYQGSISQTTVFKIVADYGNGEVEQRESRVTLNSGSTGSIYGTGGSGSSSGVSDQRGIFDVKPEQIELDGTPNSVFTALSDRCSDDKVREIRSLELSVDQVMDYRKLGTVLPLLGRFPLQIDQRVMIQTGDFARLEYQGSVRGFQSFFSTINTLLNTPDVQADVNLKLTFEFDSTVTPGGSELNTIKQALLRNPVERLYLSTRVTY